MYFVTFHHCWVSLNAACYVKSIDQIASDCLTLRELTLKGALAKDQSVDYGTKCVVHVHIQRLKSWLTPPWPCTHWKGGRGWITWDFKAAHTGVCHTAYALTMNIMTLGPYIPLNHAQEERRRPLRFLMCFTGLVSTRLCPIKYGKRISRAQDFHTSLSKAVTVLKNLNNYWETCRNNQYARTV